MSLRTPLNRVLGLGSAKEGTDHWWNQRMTAIALIPLSLWFVISVASLGSLDYSSIVAWIGAPLNTVLLVLLVTALTYHSMLGVQVVIEDYVHAGWLKLGSLILANFAHVALGTAGVFAVLRIAFGGMP